MSQLYRSREEWEEACSARLDSKARDEATLDYLFTRLAEAERERDEARAELGRIKRALPEQAATVEAWETLRRERDEARTALARAAELFVSGDREGTREFLCDRSAQTTANAFLLRLRHERDEARAEVERLNELIASIDHHGAAGLAVELAATDREVERLREALGIIHDRGCDSLDAAFVSRCDLTGTDGVCPSCLSGRALAQPESEEA